MPPSTPPPPPAGWYPDPEGTDLRWWDGKLWTDHVHADPASGNSPHPMRQDSLSVRTGRIRTVAVVGRRWNCDCYCGTRFE